MILFLKKYGYAALASLLALLAFLTKFFYSRSEKFKKQAEQAKANADHIEKVMKEDIETEMDHESRSAKIVKDIEENGHTDELSDPNKW